MYEVRNFSWKVVGGGIAGRRMEILISLHAVFDLLEKFYSVSFSFFGAHPIPTPTYQQTASFNVN